MPISQHVVNYDRPHHEIAPSQNMARTMSSQEIAKLTKKRHDNVKRLIEDLAAGGFVHPQSEDEWSTDKIGRPRATRIYNVSERDSYVIVAQLSPEFTGKLVDRWQYLEKKAQAPVLPTSIKVVGELAIMECFTRLLKPAPSSQMMMLTKIAQNNGLDPQFLPGYAIDAAPDAAGGSSMPTKAVTALIKDNGIACTAPVFNLALERHGFLKIMTRKNSKQEVVEFWSVTDKGLAYGKNLTSPQSPRETQPHWYVDRFLELAGLVGKGRP
ncbi:Rha family transcriptional regulator [Pseudomonas amygdali]|uniref:Rha family transcriptional regulator n=1 Tax=Pseudomonas amygdali TaxID=47877 RepID=UPI0009B0BAA2|nr:Rha family transcriptional regulator [Pseudomonas amygdali]ARA80233.1 Rha family transcriptional regulator [Pseudomonas amygdali pv. lachrymans]